MPRAPHVAQRHAAHARKAHRKRQVARQWGRAQDDVTLIITHSQFEARLIPDQVLGAKRAQEPGFGAFLAMTSSDLESATLHRALLAYQVLSARQNGAPAQAVQEVADELLAVPQQHREHDRALMQARFRDFTPHPLVDAHRGTEVLIALQLGSRAEVDEVTELAMAAGGRDFRPGRRWLLQTALLLYAVRMASDLSPEMAACAAASRAIGTRYGEQDT